MHIQHLDFLQWTSLYDTGGTDMRSKAKHDQWQKLLSCPLLELDGSEPLDGKFEKVKKMLEEQNKQDKEKK